MKHITVTIPDSFYQSFIDFFKHIPGATIKEETSELPNWQKNILDERRAKGKPEDFIPWEEAKQQLRFKT
jgi:hypothetical protein